MSGIFHVNGITGKVGRCGVDVSLPTGRGCPFRSDEEHGNHFDTARDAEAYSQKVLKSKYESIPSLSKKDAAENDFDKNAKEYNEINESREAIKDDINSNAYPNTVPLRNRKKDTNDLIADDIAGKIGAATTDEIYKSEDLFRDYIGSVDAEARKKIQDQYNKEYKPGMKTFDQSLDKVRDNMNSISSKLYSTYHLPDDSKRGISKIGAGKEFLVTFKSQSHALDGYDQTDYKDDKKYKEVKEDIIKLMDEESKSIKGFLKSNDSMFKRFRRRKEIEKSNKRLDYLEKESKNIKEFY